MLSLALQAIILAVFSFSFGLLLGGWLIGSRRQASEKQLRNELTGLKVNFRSAREDAHQLRGQLKQAEIRQGRMAKTLAVTSGHRNFMLVRQKLELARREIQLLKAELSRREDLVFDLSDVIHTLRKHVRLRRQSQLQPAGNNIVKLPVVGPAEDNLELIEGMTDDAAHQLRSLGLVSYRQIAESTPQQLDNIQRLLGGKQQLPLKQWVLSARQLCWQKYGKPARTTLKSAQTAAMHSR